MANNNRMSMMSAGSFMGGPRNANTTTQQSSQVSTTTLLNAIHNIYTSAQPYRLDASTSLVVNTWLTATHVNQDGSAGGVVDAGLAARAWEHARRRAEDGCIMLGYEIQYQTRAMPTNDFPDHYMSLHRRSSSRSCPLCLLRCHLHYIPP